MSLGKLRVDRARVKNQISVCWNISENQKLKNKLAGIEMEIAKASGNLKEYLFREQILKRINDLETDKIKAEYDKVKCADLSKYRRLLETIKNLEAAIKLNKAMLK